MSEIQANCLCAGVGFDGATHGQSYGTEKELH